MNLESSVKKTSSSKSAFSISLLDLDVAPELESERKMLQSLATMHPMRANRTIN
jgi:hypothetical protein